MKNLWQSELFGMSARLLVHTHDNLMNHFIFRPSPLTISALGETPHRIDRVIVEKKTLLAIYGAMKCISG